MSWYELILFVYVLMGGITVLLSMIAVFFGDKLRIVVAELELSGWRYAISVLILFILVFILWPVVLVQSTKE